MNKIEIPKPGKPQAMLLDELRKLKNEFASLLNENKAVIEDLPNGYRVKAEKNIVFFTFYVYAEIEAREGAYEISWETNAPAGKVEEALSRVKEAIRRI